MVQILELRIDKLYSYVREGKIIGYFLLIVFGKELQFTILCNKKDNKEISEYIKNRFGKNAKEKDIVLSTIRQDIDM